MMRICFHGAESTGKSVLAQRLAADMGCPWVPEYGRAYAEKHGTDFSLDDLLAIARGQDAAMRAVCANQPALVLLDTDPLMTAAWAQMLLGAVPPELLAYDKAEHYLLFAADTPWQDDGTRLFGTPVQRVRFAAAAHDILVRAGVPFTPVSGDWSEREAQVRDTLARLAAPSPKEVGCGSGQS